MYAHTHIYFYVHMCVYMHANIHTQVKAYRWLAVPGGLLVLGAAYASSTGGMAQVYIFLSVDIYVGLFVLGAAMRAPLVAWRRCIHICVHVGRLRTSNVMICMCVSVYT